MDDSTTRQRQPNAAPGAASKALYPRVVGDVGGTHARFGWVAGPDGGVTAIEVFATAAHAGLADALSRYLETPRAGGRPLSCAIGIAAPITGDDVVMTNLDWSFSIAALRRLVGIGRLLVLNDYEALALSLPTLDGHEKRLIGSASPTAGVAPGAPCALLGAGTGLGVAGLVMADARMVPIVGEGGHVSLAPADAVEDRLLARLRQRFGSVSAERVLSGPGLENLHSALGAIEGRTPEPLSASEITARAMLGNPECRAVVERFFAFLGGVAGDLALTLGARGGVYIGGGIVPRLGDWIERSAFRERFEAKGRYRPYLAAIPTWLITDASAAALRGADRALDAKA